MERVGKRGAYDVVPQQRLLGRCGSQAAKHMCSRIDNDLLQYITRMSEIHNLQLRRLNSHDQHTFTILLAAR